MNAEIARQLFPYASAQIIVDGHVLRYVDEGAGSDSVMRSWESDLEFYYRKVIERFSANHRVIAVDHLGCGRSDKPSLGEFDYRFASHRDNLVRLVETLDLSNVTLVAHDWGGAIGLASLLKTRDRFSRIVLLNTGAFVPPLFPFGSHCVVFLY